MSEKRPNTKRIVLCALILVVLVGLVTAVYVLFSPKPVAGEKQITVQIIYEDKTKKQIDIDTDEMYLRGALESKELISGEEGEYGLFVKTVDGITADESKEQWWCFTKGGEAVMTSVDQTPIADGDQFEITLTTGYES